MKQKIQMFIIGMTIAILLILAFSFLMGCGKPIENTTYKVGDIVYVKPDTLPAVITRNTSCSGTTLKISYRDMSGKSHEAYIKQEEIFEKFTNKSLTQIKNQ